MFAGQLDSSLGASLLQLASLARLTEVHGGVIAR
jgi:hypothetical protein